MRDGWVRNVALSADRGSGFYFKQYEESPHLALDQHLDNPTYSAQQFIYDVEMTTHDCTHGHE